MGSQSFASSDSPVNRGAATPMISYGASLSRMVVPRTSRSAPNRRDQRSWPSTTTRDPGAPLSSRVKLRPSTTGTPSTRKNPSPTISPVTCSTSPSAARLNGRALLTGTISSKPVALSPSDCTSSTLSGYGTFPSRRISPRRRSRRWGSRYGRASRSTAFTSVNTVLVAPMPMASVSTAASAKPGLRRNDRIASAMSASIRQT